MTAKELMQRFSMAEHVENGAFVERHYEHTGPGRAASGSIYYYVAPDELTEFHRIDCDEYWCYTAGAPLELWQVAQDGSVRVSLLGTDEGCEPIVYIPRGVIFASKHGRNAEDGTFLTCITVPRFTYEGFTMLSKEEMLADYPAIASFYSIPHSPNN